MTTQGATSDARLAAAQQVFDELALDYLDIPGVSRGRMFASEGLSTHGKLFAFIGREGRLVMKLPRSQAVALIDRGEATAVVLGRRTMREWVRVPPPTDGEGADRRRDLMDDAYRYVRALTGSSEPESRHRARAGRGSRRSSQAPEITYGSTLCRPAPGPTQGPSLRSNVTANR